MDKAATLDNKVSRFDDRIWDAHYPPNGFNCRCMVKALREEDLKEQELQVSKSDGNRMKRRRKSERTKAPAKRSISVGSRYDFIDAAGNPQTMTPDWNYNPGKAQSLSDLAGEQFLAPAPGGKNYRDFNLPDADKTPATLLLPAPPRLPHGKDKYAQLRAIKTAVGMPRNGVRVVRTPGRLDDVAIRREYLSHLVKKQHREEWANYILPTLEDPLEVWLSPVKLKPSGKIVYRRRFITLFNDAGKTRGALAVAQENKDSSLLWTFFQGRDFKYLDKQREGFLLYRKQAGR